MATSESGQFRIPPSLEVNSGNVSKNYKRWKRQMQVYLATSGASAKDDKIQTAIILNCAGPRVLEVYDNIVWEKHKPAKVLEALENYCNPRDNEVLESHRFWNTPYQEPFDKFLTELKTRVASCNFQEKDRMMRDKIVFTVTGKLQELLLRVDVSDILGPNTYQVSGPDGGMYKRNRVHVRPTKVTPKARDKSPVVLPHIPDVTPLTLPEETPRMSNPPMDPPVETSQSCGVDLLTVLDGH
ncbi:hypothetical protein ACROYT_G030080 [Oculina patagonica]